MVIAFAAAAGLCNGAEEHLVAHWRLDGDLDPIVWDDGPHGLHGTAYNITYGRGAIGLAAVFDSTRGEILIRDEAGPAPLQIGALADATGRPTRFIGMHFFNPPPAMKLVEIVPTERTGKTVVEEAVG